MKKFKTVLVFALGILATAIFGACSCTKDSTISVTSLTLTTQVANSKNENGKLVIDVVVEDDFEITYNLAPKVTTNTKVYVDIVTPGGSAYLTPESYIFENGTSYSVGFSATSINDDPTSVEVKFTSDSANHTASALVRIHDLPEPLTSPQNLQYTNGKLSWEAVEHADKYIVAINGEDYTTPSTQFTPVLESGVTNVVNVTAVSESIEYVNSQPSESIKVFPITTPTITSSNNGVLEWSPVENATKYILDVNGTKYELASEILTYDIKTLTVSSAYTIKLKAVFEHRVDSVMVDGSYPYTDEDGILNYVLSSDFCQTLTINRLSAPTNLKISNKDGNTATAGILVWNKVLGASSYTVCGNNGSDFEYTVTDTYLDFANMTGFDYIEGQYTLTVKANGLPSNTIADSDSVSEAFTFVKMGYLSGTINKTDNSLNIDVSELYANGLDSETVGKIKYDIIFVYDSQTGNLRNKNVSIVSDTATVGLSVSTISAGEYRKVLIRPFVDDTTILNVANATKINIVDQVSKYADGFTKLPNSVVASITKESMLNVDIEAQDVESFEITLDNDATEIVSKSAECITVTDAQVVVDLTKLNFGFGTTELSSGVHSIKVRALASLHIDADVASTTAFAFTKLNAVSNITVSSNKLTWSGVQNNSGYKVDFNTLSEVVYENTYTPSSVQNTNTAKVTALGNDSNVINSDTITNNEILRADKVDKITIVDGSLLWENQAGSNHIIKFYYDGTFQKEQTTTSNTFNTFNLNQTSSLSITRRVEGKFDSLESDKIKVEQRTKVSTESISVVDNGYKVKYANGESSPVSVKIVDSSNRVNTQRYEFADQTWDSEGNATITLNSAYFGIGLNYITITKLGDNVEEADQTQTYKVRSQESERVEIEVLPVLTHKIENGILSTSIDSKNNPKSMNIKITSVGLDQTVNVEGKTAEFDLSNLASGTYNVVASAKANRNTNVINGTESMFEITKIAGTTLKVVDGKVVFDKITDASGYTVKMYNAQDEFVKNLTTNTSAEQGIVNIDSASLTPNVDYKLSIIVLSNTQLYSNESTTRTIQKLATVQNFTKQSGELSWDNVINNSGYVLNGQNGFVYNQTLDEETTQHEMPNDNFESAGKYTISITVCGNTTSQDGQIGYLNSEPTTLSVYKLNSPTNISLVGGVLSWDSYTAIGQEGIVDTKVKIKVGDDTYEYECGSNTNLDLNTKTELADNGFTITIQFLGNSNDTIDSAVVNYSDGAVVSRLQQPVFRVENGELCFAKVSNAGSYEFYLKQSDTQYTLVDSQNYTLQDKDTYYVVKFNNTALIANSTLNIVGKSKIASSDNSTKLDGFYSDMVKVSKLRFSEAGLSIGEYNGVGGRLVWDKVTNATDYTIYINGTEFEQKISVSGSATEYYDISGLDLQAGVYYITIRANGNTATTTSINYLNSDISNSVKISLKNDAIKTVVENDILKWDRVEGVDSYKITITDGLYTQTNYVQESGQNQYNLKNDAFLNTGGQTYTISVVPHKLKSSYYLVKSSSPVYILVVKAYDIFNLGITDGYITWKVNTTGLSESDLTELNSYYLRYRDDAEAREDDLEGKKKYQKYYPYFNFELVLNGVSTNIIPTMMTNDPLDTSYVKYYYLLSTPVQANTCYTINVRSCGNKCVLGEDNNILTDVKTVISSKLLQTELVAYKTTVPSGITTQDGRITFNLVTTADSTKPYIQKYLLQAIPNADGVSPLQTVINVSDEYLETSPSPSTYTFNVKEWVANEELFRENIEYNYMICAYGTVSGDTTSTETLYLRSNYYSTIGMTFLSSISVGFSKNWTVNGEKMGAVVNWSILTTKESMTHILYILPENEASNIGLEWWKDSSTITITLDSKTNYFDFASDLAKEKGIVSGITYRVSAKYGGDERSFITNDENPNYINVTTLSTTSFEGSKVKNGVFEWKSNEYASGYKVTLFKNVNGDITNQIYYTEQNKFAVETNTSANAQYTIAVMPFGNTVSGTNYVNGFANDGTAPYYSLMGKVDGLVVQVVDGNNTLLWDAVDGATNYTVAINETEYQTSSTRYTLPNFSAGVYTIKVMAKATTNYLNGVYSDAVRVRKLYNPQLKVVDGVVSWSRGDNTDEVLSSASTILTVKACDADGNITVGGKSESLTLTKDDGQTYALGTTYNNGYYKIAVKYDVSLVSSGAVSEYQLSSEESTMVSYKLDPVSTYLQGQYVEPTDTTTVRDCSFDNYIKWKKVDNAFGYAVRLLDEDDGLIDTNIKQIVYQLGVMTGDTGYFEDCANDDTYICFNLAQMSAKRVSIANIQVTVLGNSTTGDTLGYLNSNSSSFKVELPQGAPKIISTANGVIKWTGAYDFTEEGEIVNTYSETAVASNVEIEFTNAITYTYDSDSNTRTQSSQTVKSNYIWEYAEGKEQVFYCPYASSSNIYVRVRYYNSNYVSNWSYIGTISNNDLFVAGMGTSSDPYVIAKLNDESDKVYRDRVTNIKYRPNSYFVVKHDVNMTGTTWKTIQNFGGVIDGEDHSISNITLNDRNVSIFGTLLEGSQIKNINFADITMSTKSSINVAPIAITNNGTITSVVVSGSTNSLLNDGNDIKFGGMVVTNNGTISSSTVGFKSQVSGMSSTVLGIYISSRDYAYVGGFVVDNNGKIDDCTLDSVVTVSIGNLDYKRQGCVGGIAYSNTKSKSDSSISNCNVLSTSVLTATSIGGVVYKNEYNAVVSHCSMQAKCVLNTIVGSEGGNQIELDGYFGGLVGINKGFVSDSYVNLSQITFNSGLTSSLYVGLLVGYSETYSTSDSLVCGGLSNCYISADSSLVLPSDTNTGYNVGYVVGCINNQNEVFENIYIENKNVGYDMVGTSSISVSVTKTDFASWKTENDF